MKKIITLSLLTALCLIHPLPASAETLGFETNPTTVEITIRKDGMITQEINITNTSEKPLTLSPNFRPFTASSKTNGSVVYPQKNETASDTANFIEHNVQLLENNQPANEITLAPKQKKTLVLSININNYQKISSYTFSLLLISKPVIGNDSQGQTNTKSEVRSLSKVSFAVPVHILISQKIKYANSASIEDFSTTRKFIDKSPVEFNAIIKNSSNEYINIYSNISIFNMFGQNVATLRTQPIILLAHSMRTLRNNSGGEDGIYSLERSTEASWKPKFLLGWYTARLDILDENGNTLSPSASLIFYSFPVLGVTLLLLIGIVILVITSKVKKSLSN